MPEQPQLIYLEPDDEITSVVRRLRAAESGKVVIVAPGRSRATSSAVALRLLAQVAAEEARSVSLVADAPTRAVATEAGIPAFASVAEATSGSALPDKAAATPRAPIHVVRGASETTVPPLGPGLTGGRSGAGDETMATRLPPQTKSGGSGQRKGRRRIPRWPWLTGLLIFALIVSAALLPGATVSITPATQPVGPRAYQLHLPIAGHESADTQAMRPGTATGTRLEQVAATGTVTFFNWNTVAIEVPLGTKVSVAGGVAFTTTERIVVPKGRFGPPAKPGERSAGVVAAEAGTSGNVAAGTIDTVDDASIRALLRGFPDNPNSLVTNLQPTAGGVETPHSVILQSDVDAVVAGLQTDLTSHLADLLAGQPDRVYAAAPASEVPQINLQPDLVGTEDQATFNLTGTLAFNRPYVLGADLKAAARAALERDDIAPQGTSIIEGSIQVEPGTATANGDEMTIAVTVRAAAAAAIDKAAVQDKVAGKTVPEAKTALAPLGKVQVALWPNWLDRLPRLPFRIAVVTVAPSDGASPSP